MTDLEAKNVVRKALRTGWRFSLWDFVRDWSMTEHEACRALAALIEAGEIKCEGKNYYRDDIKVEPSDIDPEARPNGRNETYGT